MQNYRCSILAMVFLVAPQAAVMAQSQQAVAVITELKFNRGDIQIRAAGGKAVERPAVLQSLYPGNIVQTTQDAVAVVFFTDGTSTVTVDENNPRFEVKTRPAKDRSGGSRIKEVADLLVGKKKPANYVALAVRGKAQPPTLLAPRNSRIMTDTPTFHWLAVDQQPGTVKVFGPQGVIWSAENISLTKIAYPASAPRLRPEVEYAWAMEKKGFAASRVTFRILRPDEAQSVQDRLTELSGMSGLSKTTLAVLQANFLMSKDLFYEAREILLEGTAADPNEPTLHFVLGELYDKTGLRNLATASYGEAEFLSKSKF